MKIARWLSEHILFIITLFLLAFIPLYPKLPLIDISHTWVKIRIEDFLVSGALIIWIVQVIRKKATVKTPLTLPIILFWAIGSISTVYAVFYIFPYIANVFPNIAWLNYLRRIEYISLFFIAFSAIRNKKYVQYIPIVLSLTLIGVTIYGLGQKSFSFTFTLFQHAFTIGWPQTFYAYSTMNEEFAKGIPLLLSPLGRIQSTFGGHYDLAAYLVMVIPIMGSMIFGFKNKFSKLYFLLTAIGGLVLLLLTASRVSFAVYLLTISFMFVLQKKKILIIPVVILSILLLQSFQGISQRFGSTISQVDLVVDARTGKAVGIAKKVDKTGAKKPVLIEETQQTGETLPQGTGFINLPAEPSTKTITKVQYKRSMLRAGSESAQITNIEGDFVVKKALAYDVSFTTRFQGEWPRALEAFKRNVLLGSGYSSISLATDNDYLRMLGEVGIFGTASFALIFIIIGIYIRRVVHEVSSPVAKSLILGITAGIFGLGLNAILIDVFEASKVAFVLWMLVGVAIGLLHMYQKERIHFRKEIVNVFISTPAITIYLLLASIGIFSIMLNNYFVADDFTWLRWVADCKKVLYSNGVTKCEPTNTTLLKFFTDSHGFFYRPGAKLYFYIMYAMFWLSPFAYHVMSLLGHFVTTTLVFLISFEILKKKSFALITAFLFLVISSHAEAIFWISSSGHIFASVFILLALYLFILWRKTKMGIFLIGSLFSCIISPTFQELGIVAPFLVIAYDLIFEHPRVLKHIARCWYYPLFLFITPFYLIMRNNAKSLGPQGDYSYSLSHLPYNIAGNLLGYIMLTIIGSNSLDYYRQFRDFGKGNIVIAAIIIIAVFVVFGFLYRSYAKHIKAADIKIIFASLAFFIIPLLPFIALGNIAPRYGYLASFGVLLLLSFGLQKIDYILEKANKYLGLCVVGLCVASFMYLHIQELERINKQWKQAGAMVNNVLITLNDTFPKHNATPQNPVFYFVNIPTRIGEAWVFPVGLPDALWFTFQNENLTVHTKLPLDLALDAAEGSQSARVFEFDKVGNVSGIERTRTTKEVTIEKK